MKNYKTPELNITMIAEIGDVITYSYSNNGMLGKIGEQEEDGQLW